MKKITINIYDRFLMLLSGAFSSCALFVKYGDDIYHFNSPTSLGRDWKMISEDMGVAMYKLRDEYEEQ